MQVKLSVLILILIGIFLVFHFYGMKNENLELIPTSIYATDLRPAWNVYNAAPSTCGLGSSIPTSPVGENFNPDTLSTPVYNIGGEEYNSQGQTLFQASLNENNDAIIYADGTPMEEITPIYD